MLVTKGQVAEFINLFEISKFFLVFSSLYNLCHFFSTTILCFFFTEF